MESRARLASSVDEPQLNIETRPSFGHAGATVDYEFSGDQVMVDRQTPVYQEDGISKKLEELLLAEDWHKLQATTLYGSNMLGPTGFTPMSKQRGASFNSRFSNTFASNVQRERSLTKDSKRSGSDTDQLVMRPQLTSLEGKES